MQLHRRSGAPHWYAFALMFGLLSLACLPVGADTPREDFENPYLLELAKKELQSLNRDQLEAVIAYLADCSPPPAQDRDQRCARASTVLSIKTSKARALKGVTLAVFVTDKTFPWSRANLGESEVKALNRRVEIFAELRAATAERYEALIR